MPLEGPMFQENQTENKDQAASTSPVMILINRKRIESGDEEKAANDWVMCCRAGDNI